MPASRSAHNCSPLPCGFKPDEPHTRRHIPQPPMALASQNRRRAPNDARQADGCRRNHHDGGVADLRKCDAAARPEPIQRIAGRGAHNGGGYPRLHCRPCSSIRRSRHRGTHASSPAHAPRCVGRRLVRRQRSSVRALCTSRCHSEPTAGAACWAWPTRHRRSNGIDP